MDREAFDRLLQREKEFFANWVNPENNNGVIEVDGVKVRVNHLIRALKGRVSRRHLVGDNYPKKAKVPNQRLEQLNKNPSCTYCGKKLDATNSTLDHKTPISKGGKGGDNLVLACKKCNGIKSDMSLYEWNKILPILKAAGYLQMSKAQRRRWRAENPGIVPVVPLPP